MPRLQQYQSPIDKIQPSDRGTEAQLMGARRIGHFYNQAAGEISAGARAVASAAGDVAASVEDIGRGVKLGAALYEEYQDKRAISQGQAEGEQMFAGLKEAWNNTVKVAGSRDPNDPSVAGKFREEVLEPALQKFQEAYSGSPRAAQWAENYTQRIRHHMFETTTADMATLAGVAATTNIQTLKTTATNTAHSNPDFRTSQFLLKNVDEQVDAIINASPNLKGVVGEKLRIALTADLKESIVKAGAIGAIARSNDPEREAERWVAKYPDQLSGTDAKQLAANARQQSASMRADENYKRHLEKLEKERVSDDAEAEWMKRLYSDDPKENAKITTRAIINDPRLSNSDKYKLRNLVEREMKPESDAKISARTSNDLFRRLYLPADDPQKINDLGPIIEARNEGKLTKADFHDLRNEFVTARTPEGEKLGKDRDEFFKRYAATIDGAMDFGGHSALGSQKIYEAQQDARRVEADLRRKGLDPHLVYDPKSEYFFGKPENLTKYHVSMQAGLDYQKRLSDQNKLPTNITGVETIDLKPGEKTFVPPSNWQFSPSRRQYRDPSGKIYSIEGNPVQ